MRSNPGPATLLAATNLLETIINMVHALDGHSEPVACEWNIILIFNCCRSEQMTLIEKIPHFTLNVRTYFWVTTTVNSMIKNMIRVVV